MRFSRATCYLSLLLGASLAPATASPIPASQAPAYTVLDLGPVASGNYLFQPRINDAGQVAYASGFGIFRYSDASGPVRIAPGPGLSRGINSQGDVVGHTMRQTDGFGFRYSDGGGLERLPEGYVPMGINDRGDITGFGPAGGWMADAALNVRSLGVPNLIPLAINNSGLITGEQYDGSFSRAVVYSEAGGLQTILTPGDGFGNSINDLGQVAGYYRTDAGYTRPFLALPGQAFMDLGTLGGEATSNTDPSLAWDLNEAGMAVGASRTQNGEQHAFLYTPGAGMQDLNSFLGDESGWKLSEATGINNQGQIVGCGVKNHQGRVFRLTPTTAIPEPGTLALLAMGLVPLARRRKVVT